MLHRRSLPVAGRYVLLEEIGRGATGPVHRARDLRTRTYVAAKVLRGGDPDALLRFVREQAHRIDHPHVLSPLGWAAEDDVALIAMELVRGGSLVDLLARDGQPAASRSSCSCSTSCSTPWPRSTSAAWSTATSSRPTSWSAAASGRTCCWPTSASPPAAASRRRSVPAPPPTCRRSGGPALRPQPSQDVYAAGLVARRLLSPTSPLQTLCDSMTRPEPELRPTARAARRRLRELTGPR